MVQNIKPGGFARAAEAMGMDAPRPRLRVVKEAERELPKSGDGVWRPASFSDYIGQGPAKVKANVIVTSALKKNREPRPILISGPPGTGKTSMANVITLIKQKYRAEHPPADEPDLAGVPVKLHVVMGTTVKTQAQMAVVLAELRTGDVLFVDECHRMSVESEEMIGLAMEDGRITVPGAKGAPPQVIKIKAFTLVCATTLPGKMSKPMLDRFVAHITLELYDIDELAEIVRRTAGREGYELADEVAESIARVSWGTPRKAVNAWDMTVAYVDTIGEKEITEDTLAGALEVMGIDEYGLDDRDRDYMMTIHNLRKGKRIGEGPISAATGIDKDTLRTDMDPRLARGGWLDQNGRGRCLTERAYEVLEMFKDVGRPTCLGLS